MVDTKDQSNAILYWICYVVCRHCQHEDQSMQCIECYVCQHCQHWCLWLLHNTVYRVMRCENCTLLCIKWPLAPAKREGYLKSLLSCGFSCSLVWGGSFVKRSLSCIDSVDIDSIECIRDPCLVLTVSTYIVLMVWLKSPQSQLFKTFYIENWLNIKKVMGSNVWMCFVWTVLT